MRHIIKKRLIIIVIWVLFSMNLLFAFNIGLAISLMESEKWIYLGSVIIPLLLILNYVYLDRIYNYLRHTLKEGAKLNETHKTRDKKNKPPVIQFRGKKYSFLTRALILFPVAIIIIALSMNQFLKKIEIIWLHELFAKHQVFFLNLIFSLGAQTSYMYNTWFVGISENVRVYINNGCTGLIAMSIFIAVIIFTPHSKNQKTKEDIIWRKTKAIIFSIFLIYFYNIFRAVIQFYLYSRGFAWSVVHDSLGMLSITIFTHVCIFLFCTKYLPEFYVSIYYSGKIIYKELRKERLAETFYYIKQTDQKGKYDWIRELLEREGMSLYLINKYDIDSRLIQFLKENNEKYTAKAIKNRLFNQQDRITEDLLEKMLQILANAEILLSDDFDGKIYYFF